MRLSQLIIQFPIDRGAQVDFLQKDYKLITDAIESADEKTLHETFCNPTSSLFSQAKKVLIYLFNLYHPNLVSIRQLLIEKFSSRDLVTISGYTDEYDYPIVCKLFEHKETKAAQAFIARLNPSELIKISQLQAPYHGTTLHYIFRSQDSATCLALINKLGWNILFTLDRSKKNASIWYMLFMKNDLEELCLSLINQLDAKDLVSVCKKGDF